MKAVIIAAAGRKQTMIVRCVSNPPQCDAQRFYLVIAGIHSLVCVGRQTDVGAAGGDRTHDPWLRRPILYPLSYSRNAGNGLRRILRPGGREIRAICIARAVHAAQRARFYQPAAAPPGLRKAPVIM